MKSNESTDDVVQESKVKYGKEKVKFEILDALIRYYEVELARIKNVDQNQQTTTTAENNLMSVEDIILDYLSNVTSSTTTGLTLKEISKQLNQFSEIEIK